MEIRKRLNLNWRNLLRLSLILSRFLKDRNELEGRTSVRVVTGASLRSRRGQTGIVPKSSGFPETRKDSGHCLIALQAKIDLVVKLPTRIHGRAERRCKTVQTGFLGPVANFFFRRLRKGKKAIERSYYCPLVANILRTWENVN